MTIAYPSPPATSLEQVTHRAILEQALCHASLLIERVIFFNRSLGLLPRTTTAQDPLGSLCIDDQDVSTILSGFRLISKTPPSQRATLITDPHKEPIDASRQELQALLRHPQARNLGLVEVVHNLQLDMDSTEALLLILAPDLDARFGTLYGFLNNDPGLARPTLHHIQTAIQPWCPGLDAPTETSFIKTLIRNHLVRLNDPSLPEPRWTLSCPSHLAALVRMDLSREYNLSIPWVSWDKLYWPEKEKNQLRDVLLRETRGRVLGERPLVLLESSPRTGRCAAAIATADELSCQVVYRDLSATPLDQDDESIFALLTGAVLEARVRNALLILRSDGFFQNRLQHLRSLSQLVMEIEVFCVLLIQPDEIDSNDMRLRLVRVPVPRTGPQERRAIWSDATDGKGLRIAPDTFDEITARFELAPGRIHELANELVSKNLWTGQSHCSLNDIQQVLRSITTRQMGQKAVRSRSAVNLSDLILKDSVRSRLDYLIHRVKYRYKVLDQWGFARKGGASGHGVSALFTGPPGTGKTAAAGAIAQELEVDLYIVDLSGIVSKWVGETEQNLAKIFDEAEASHSALLFDEADSLFGKRSSKMESANDRYSNMTVNYLLQRIERYTGLVILTSNLESAIDSAFSRRLSARVYFPAPSVDERIQLWRILKPHNISFGDDVDIPKLAKDFDLSGARIRNALMRAAFKLAGRGGNEPLLKQRDLIEASIIECEDMGKLVRYPEGF